MDVWRRHERERDGLYAFTVIDRERNLWYDCYVSKEVAHGWPRPFPYTYGLSWAEQQAKRMATAEFERIAR